MAGPGETYHSWPPAAAEIWHVTTVVHDVFHAPVCPDDQRAVRTAVHMLSLPPDLRHISLLKSLADLLDMHCIFPVAAFLSSFHGLFHPGHDPESYDGCTGLVEVLMEEGCVVCATSNRAPWELSASGLHEDLFAHFLASLQSACRPVLLSSQHDYRRLLFAENQVTV